MPVAVRGHRLGDGPGPGGGIVELGAGQGERAAVEPALVQSAGDQDQPVGQQRGGVLLAGGVHVPRHRPLAGGRVVELGAGRVAAEVVVAGGEPAGDKHHAVAQQGGGVLHAADVHAAGLGPGAGGRVIELRAGLVAQEAARVAAVIGAVAGAAGDEHLAAGQQGSRLPVPRVDHRSGQGPFPGGRVVELRAAQAAACARAAPAGHEYVAAGQQAGGRVAAGDRHAAGRGEAAGGRVVQLGGGAAPAGDQHLPVGQQRSCPLRCRISVCSNCRRRSCRTCMGPRNVQSM